jgi:hypothetical protein
MIDAGPLVDFRLAVQFEAAEHGNGGIAPKSPRTTCGSSCWGREIALSSRQYVPEASRFLGDMLPRSKRLGLRDLNGDMAQSLAGT